MIPLQSRHLKVLINRNEMIRNVRWKTSYTANRYVSSKIIRQQFLDYFVRDNNYNFVRSSPVVPFCDPTVPFVNAGMNQFKGVFLGSQEPKFAKVANVQKCIRVGGKHNDLSVVGTDGYHHTFFEMLGNWTFGECSKQQVCQLAWNLLTDVYHLNKECLYVTYFAGDETLELGPDRECKEVWRSIGVPENRILPFGIKENFWEMGLTGPCGPCTEIHFDHRGLITGNRSAFVNKGLFELVELWNIVFIEYNRNDNGTMTLLPKKHVDTGMGFERLTSVVQGCVSNYDTDVFRSLFIAIQRNCTDCPRYRSYFGEKDWNHMNTSYRILADHARMITVCLADGMIPEQNHKLRKILRRAFVVGENTFRKKRGLIKELSNYVIESLGCIYPELEKNAKQIHQIIDYEEDVYHFLRKTASQEWSKITSDTPALSSLDFIEMPGLVQAYKEIENKKLAKITPDLALKLYDTYGLDADAIGKLSASLKINFDENEFNEALEKTKLLSKSNRVSGGQDFIDYTKLGPKTDDSFKYDYKKVGVKYVFIELPVQVLQIIRGAEFVDSIEPNTECVLILDKTNLYCESGGQMSDQGVIAFDIGDFEVYDIKNVNNYILHKGILKSKLNLTKHESGKLKFKPSVRLGNMQNHTATHLLNAQLKKIKGATCQKSSKVTDKFLNFDVSVFGEKINFDDVKRLQESVKQVINEGAKVDSYEVDSQTLLNMDGVTVIPGEAYPETGIRLIEITSNGNVISREPCCGTHVHSTSDIKDFVVVQFKSLGRSTSSIFAVTGERAKLAETNGTQLREFITQLRRNVEGNMDKPDVLEIAVATLRQQLEYDVAEDAILPITVKHECAEELNEISKRIKENARNSLKEFIDMEMKSVMNTKTMRSETNKEFIVHYLRTSMILESVPLQRATKICHNLPVLIISYTDNVVKARCCVPENFINDQFTAEKWLKVIGDIFHSQVAPPKGQDPTVTCNLKGKRVSMTQWHALLNDSLEAAKHYAKTHL